jgi:hypothetical protein
MKMALMIVDMLAEKLAALRETSGSTEGLKAFSFDIQELT